MTWYLDLPIWLRILVAVALTIVAAAMKQCGPIDLDDTQQRSALIVSAPITADTAPPDSHGPSSPVVESGGAISTTPAQRREQIQVTPTEPPPPTTTAPPTGLFGLPFAPAGLERCERMEWYRRQMHEANPFGDGLPAHFDTVGFRESSCKNYVSSFCCHGYWQLYVSLHVRDHRLGPLYEQCGIGRVADVLGRSPIQRQRNACGAAAVYSVSGGGAWDTW